MRRAARASASLLAVLCAGLCAGLAGACGCRNGLSAATQEAPPITSSPASAAPEARPGSDVGAAKVPRVVLYPDGLPAARVRVALARTEEERQQGLMFVRSLPADDGMLFLFSQERQQSFWMKNTFIPLDMIFIRDDMTVAGVVANAPPLTLEPRGVGVPSRYVLEVNGGWANLHGVTAGTQVRFEEVPR